MVEFRQPFTGEYPITLDFHEKWLPLYDNVKKFHEGIDYGCPLGTPILASADGTVVRSGFVASGYGEYIIIQHENGTGTVYAHLKVRSKQMFDKVSQGDVIGYSGSTGNSTGPHLHFEYRKRATDYTTAEDPKTVLKSVVDIKPNNPTPAPVKPNHEAIRAGLCIVVCDVLNARCHCDMSTVRDVLHKGDIISVGDQVTEYMNLPYRDFFDAKVNCWLRIAEHDNVDQLISNYDIPL